MEITLKRSKEEVSLKQFWCKIIMGWGLGIEFLCFPSFPLSMSTSYMPLNFENVDMKKIIRVCNPKDN